MTDRRSPFDVVSESLHSIDLIFNSKREDIVKRLREGNAAWEQRKKQYDSDRVLREKDSPERSKRARRGFTKDAEYPSQLSVSDLLRQAEDGRRGREVELFKLVLWTSLADHGMLHRCPMDRSYL